ncbi:MAG TPA: 4-hydroxy-tetrahydrodipicolinate reductase [Dehalococcoidia bacterium]|nr:4-hydroxy-tetrahydrodipicolinate reductase [Dehalococcoidia bacterium]
MAPIRVVVHGAGGRMGQVVLAGVCREPDLEVVGAAEKEVTTGSLPLPDGSGQVPFSADLDSLLSQCHPDVMVDFSLASATMAAVPVAARHKVNLVIGTTGLLPQDIAEIQRLTMENDIGTVVAPNFALGAVVLMHLAQIAARYFDYAEITELHHHQKADAPSGTALTTARLMAQARGKAFLYAKAQKETLSGTRGGEVEGVAIHSVRLPGLQAHQEVILGAPGQTLSLRHDAISRECYLPGVILAIKEVVKHKGLIHGLEKLLGL